jgi:hypothetical protein
MLLRHTSDINIPVSRNFPPIKSVAKQSEFQLFPPSNQTLGNSNNGLGQQHVTNRTPKVDYIC